MSPEFAAAIDPVMLEILALVERARSGRAGRPVEEHAHIRGVLEQGAALVPGTRMRDWELASYALISLIDELLIVDIPWKGQAWQNVRIVGRCPWSGGGGLDRTSTPS